MRSIFMFFLIATSIIASTTGQTNYKQERKAFIKEFKGYVNNLWGHPKGIKGEATVEFFLDMNEGNVVTVLIKKKVGSKDFDAYFKNFIKKIRNVKIQPRETSNPLVQLTINLKADSKKTKTNETIGILKKEYGKRLYKIYLKRLINEKGISKKKIAKHLKAKNDTFIKSMLFAIYYDYVKNDTKTASKYYTTLVKRYPDKLKERIEGIIVSDWLLRTGKYKLVTKLFPDRSCQFFKKPYKQQCYYMQGMAKYKLGKDYELELNIAKNYYEQAENIMKGGQK